MISTKLEPRIDHLLGEKLVEPAFLSRLVGEYNEQLRNSQASAAVDQRAVAARLNALAEKKQRVLDTFFEGIISKEERDRRMGEIEREVSAYQRLLLESTPASERHSLLKAEEVLALVEPFAEWEFLDREDRRALLAVLCPEISVYRYDIRGLTLSLAAGQSGGYEDSRRKTAW